MSSRSPRALPLVLALSLVPAGCRAAGSREAALEARAHAPISYRAEIRNRAVRLAELSELDAEPFEPIEDGLDDVVVDVKARLVATTADAAERALGWVPQERTAMVVERAAGGACLAELLARGEATEVSTPRLSVVAGRAAYITVSDQIAFLERFELVSAGPDCIADPAVGVAEEGFCLTARPERPGAEGLVPLALELAVVSLEQPMRTRRVELPGVDREVQLQTPLSIGQRLATEVELGPGDLLILGGLPADEPGTFLFLFATCDVLAPASEVGQR